MRVVDLVVARTMAGAVDIVWVWQMRPNGRKTSDLLYIGLVKSSLVISEVVIHFAHSFDLHEQNILVRSQYHYLSADAIFSQESTAPSKMSSSRIERTVAA